MRKTCSKTTNIRFARFSLRLAPTLVVAAVFILSVAAQLTYAIPGDLYVSDARGGNIYKFTPGGARSTFASGLNQPFGLAFDSAGNLFEADAGSNHIYKFTPGGTRSIFYSGLNSPAGLAFDSAGNLFEADAGSGNIYKFTPGGTRSTFASGLSSPAALAFGRAGNLFEADAGSGKIYEFTPGGTQTTFFSGLSVPVGLAFNSAGNLFEADAGSGQIFFEFTPGGPPPPPSPFASGLSVPFGLAFNSAGNLFEVDKGSGAVYEFTPGGTRSPFASGLGIPTFLAFEPTPTPAPPAANPATYVASNSFTANWSSVNFATGYRLDVATNSSFTTYVTGYENLNVGNATSRSVTGLNPSTHYYYRVRAYNGAGTSPYSNTISVTTLTATGAPIVRTNPATHLLSSSATLNGSLDPHGLTTSVSFQYGTTTSYGHTRSMQNQIGNTFRIVSANISGLSAGTRYHFRIVATNSAGTMYGIDRTFTTP